LLEVGVVDASFKEMRFLLLSLGVHHILAQ
jgi:hypothetical protein